MKRIPLIFALFFLISCQQKNKIVVDSIVVNTTIYTVNSNFDMASAMAIKEGKILGTYFGIKIITEKTLYFIICL